MRMVQVSMAFIGRFALAFSNRLRGAKSVCFVYPARGLERGGSWLANVIISLLEGKTWLTMYAIVRIVGEQWLFSRL